MAQFCRNLVRQLHRAVLQEPCLPMVKHGFCASDLAGIQIYRALLQWGRQNGSPCNSSQRGRTSLESATQLCLIFQHRPVGSWFDRATCKGTHKVAHKETQNEKHKKRKSIEPNTLNNTHRSTHRTTQRKIQRNMQSKTLGNAQPNGL